MLKIGHSEAVCYTKMVEIMIAISSGKTVNDKDFFLRSATKLELDEYDSMMSVCSSKTV